MGIESRDWYRKSPSAGPGWFSTSRVTKTLVVVNVAVYFFQLVSDRLLGWDPVWSGLGMKPDDVIGRFYVWQIFTSMFLHSPDTLLHIGFNMLVLWMFGPHVERRLGSRSFLKFYMLAGLSAGVAYVVFGYLEAAFNPAIGASGAIMGVLVYFTMLNPNAIVRFMFIIPMRMIWATAIIVGIDVYFFVFAPTASGIANSAHLGGALFGFLYYRYGHRVDRFFTGMEVKAKANSARRKSEDLDELQREMDRLLEKVYETGLDSLTAKEKKFLNEASRKLSKDRP